MYVFSCAHLLLNFISSPQPQCALQTQGASWATRARAAPLGRSTWPLELARRRCGARHGHWSPLDLVGALDFTVRALLCCGARNGHSTSLGLAGAFGMAARDRSASLGRLFWVLEPVRPRWGVEFARRRSDGRTLVSGLLRLRRSSPIRRSRPFGSDGALNIAAQAHSDGL